MARTSPFLFILLVMLVISSKDNNLFARGMPPPPPKLSEEGVKLEAEYQGMVKTLEAELRKGIPLPPKEKRDRFMSAHRREIMAAKTRSEKEQQLKEFGNLPKKLEQRKAYAEKWSARLEEAKGKLETLQNEDASSKEHAEAIASAEEALAKAQEKHTRASANLKKTISQAAQAEMDGPRFIQELDQARKEQVEARQMIVLATRELGLESFLSQEALDGKLAKLVILKEGTPRGLALFSQEGEAQQKRISQLLSNPELMVRMLEAGGAKENKYGKAMLIYTTLQNLCEEARKPGILQRVALAVSLEWTVPYKQGYPTYMTGGLKPIDPVERYLHYKKAYLSGELSPHFKDMSTWECRWIVSDPSPNEDLAWLRRMLRNYRPDLIAYPDPKWFYTRFVKTDIQYGNHGWDKNATTSKVQQAVELGGVCHIQMWIGRALARSFGIPAIRLEQSPPKPRITTKTK